MQTRRKLSVRSGPNGAVSVRLPLGGSSPGSDQVVGTPWSGTQARAPVALQESVKDAPGETAVVLEEKEPMTGGDGATSTLVDAVYVRLPLLQLS